MQVTYNEQKNGGGEFEFIIEQKDLEPHKKAALKHFQEHLDLKGFRKGNIPETVVRQRVGEVAILEEAVEQALPSIFAEALKKHSIEIYGKPSIQIEKIAPESAIHVRATFIRVPRVTLKTTSGLSIKQKKTSLDPLERERSLKELQRMHAKEQKVLRKAKMGDKAIVTFNAFMDKVPLEGGKAEKHPLVLGEKTFIPGFEEAVVGMSTGEKKKFTLTFPKDYRQKNLAGRDTEFEVHLEDLFEISLPELNDDFAKKLGKFSKLEDLTKQLDENLFREAELKEKDRVELELVKTLVEKNEIEPLPDVMIQDEEDRMVHELEHAVMRDGAKFEDYLQSIKKTKDDLKKEFETRAKERIKSALLLRAIADEKNLHATDEEIDKRLSAEKKLYAQNSEAIRQISSDEYKRHITNVLTSQKVLEYLKKENIATT